ncbi:hypothetical protein LPTSP2_37640 [Leptospira ellinghausenii]|uniref:Uncharacterized protein n=1 Tax=Leptospira ellinghausenii TaxID=1917822 RepID=A0A2P2DIP7_9LEPT|nr:hypothetical protein [Leptospira ellinghausenii]GBF44461.1 hypothetical protein LPTSP2_37640 [Leptospira ellinghausenii]
MKPKPTQLQYGDVFIWKNFDGHHDGKTIKDAWFVYLGSSSFLEINHIIRATTQTQHYSSNQSREDHSVVIFDPEKKKEHDFFKKRCLVDCTNKTFETSLSLNKLLADEQIEYMGNLPNNDLREIFLKLSKNKKIVRKTLIDIRNCLNSVGVYGLPEIASRSKLG